jgi:hypothetical protein
LSAETREHDLGEVVNRFNADFERAAQNEWPRAVIFVPV